MNLNVSQITLIDLVEQIERKEVVINRHYQRGKVWPDTAKTYFIDTILEGYPFPKIYLYQVFSEKSRRPIKELIDGQQRMTTIIDFMNDKFKLGNSSNKYSGMRYSDLDVEIKQQFLSYQIEASVVLSATRSELLEMFRRINAYTAPLSSAEKRHAIYQGGFKWFIVDLADKHSPALSDLNILGEKALSRMGDAEFISDLVVALENGIVAKTAKQIEDLYKGYDKEFPQAEVYRNIVDDFFNVLLTKMASLHETYMMKSYVVHSLFCAYVACKYGIPGQADLTNIESDIDRKFDFHKINSKLLELAEAHELQDVDGEHAEYVEACLSSTTKTAQRKIRFQTLVEVFSGE
ncbi:DUF262 domain-containing protein [Vibrio cholerae]|uniref:DUF262 domain-containing protein n=4 Tax=Vibrio cholerae TaxID=666 RepID=UPI001583BB72|nr:DUF262 domain-containing protein [Vibrio cholerae]MBJ6896270.1 DUF262 domain-containing protein [Vibrio cholerae]MBJ6899842.1 DUF262 domain-containing protein [Vibrio cholerae]MBJ6903455.1 DUF262 domain-containing protein [Vibrio cholerae]MCX9508059.1 DUF262 domain-containing protein [Vibrio cholerae]QKU80139.1 DUF262 domain-containing protein [Vibrio cholerae]